MRGLIVRALSGFYYVENGDGEIFECKARGVFRKAGIHPLVGDWVEFDVADQRGTVTEILERKNFMNRPPVANIDKLIIVSSVADPKPNLYVIDKITCFAKRKKTEPVVLFSKTDLGSCESYVEIYRKAGFESFGFSSVTGENTDKILDLFKDSVCCLTGNSGVGKSSLLNFLSPELGLATAEISTALGRGRHTTRDVSLYKIGNGFIADTPGFSSMDFENSELILKNDLPDCFPEFEPFIQACKFANNCSHRTDKGCAVREAVENGIIPTSRYESYLAMYDEVKDIKEYELPK